MRQRILEQWNQFYRQVIPADAPEIQITETRRAFFAGACSAFYLIARTDISDDETIQTLDDLRDEFNLYKERLKSGVM